jgi:four helix bundle protein
MEQTRSNFRRRTEALQQRTFDWACRILDVCPRHYPDDPSRMAWRQVIRSGPAASAILEEADEAFSDADFLYNMKRALKETKESRRWLRFILRCHLANHDRVGNLEDEASQLARIFATIYIKRKKRVDAEDQARRLVCRDRR